MPIYQGQAVRLSGTGYIEYDLGMDEDDGSLYLQMTGNDEGGEFRRTPIPFGALFALIADALGDDGSFAIDDINRGLLQGNNNDRGFVVAILIQLNIVERVDGRYRFCVDEGA